MLLSIGMIVKNEEKYLEQCLNGIKPILDSIDSELIIADTGSTDRSVEIAKKFTDNVFHFEWINDFAAARNSTVERAKGKWYMFLDADEVFQSCDNIIKFFKSGEYKKYGSASVIVRSFSNDTYTSYLDTILHRLTVLDPKLRFINPIHEHFNFRFQPTKNLNEIAYHYGYVYRDKNDGLTELAHQKCERNLNLILKNIEGKSTAEIPYASLKEASDCYYVMGDFDTALKFLYRGLRENKHDCVDITLYYDATATILNITHRNQELNDLCYEYIEEPIRKQYLLACDINMYAFIIDTNAQLGKYSEAVKFIPPFFDIYKKYTAGNFETEDIFHVTIRVTDVYYYYICRLCLQVCIIEKKYNTTLIALNSTDIAMYTSDERYPSLVADQFSDLIANIGYKKMKKYIASVKDKAAFARNIVKHIYKSDHPEELLMLMADHLNKDADEAEIVNVFSSVIEKQNSNTKELETYLEKHGTADSSDLFRFVLKNGFDISPFFRHIQASRFESFLNDLILADCTIFDEFEDYDTSIISPDVLLWAVYIYDKMLFEITASKKNIEKIFSRYGTICVQYASTAAGSINDDVKAGLIINSICEARERKDYKFCIAAMRQLIKEHPKYAKVITVYKDYLQQEVNSNNN